MIAAASSHNTDYSRSSCQTQLVVDVIAGFLPDLFQKSDFPAGLF